MIGHRRHPSGRSGRAGFTLLELLIAAGITLGIGAVVVVVFATTFRGLLVLTVKSLVTDDLRRALEQLERDIELSQDAPTVVPAALCPDDAVQSATSLVLLAPLPGVGTDAADCIVYRCQPANRCNEEDPTNLGALERVVHTDGDTHVSPDRVMARGVFTLQFTRDTLGAPTTRRVTVRLGVRQRIPSENGYQAQGQLTTMFNLRQ